jgi:hypothetical protein
MTGKSCPMIKKGYLALGQTTRPAVTARML